MTFITSFGADSDDEGVIQGPALPKPTKPATPIKRKPSPETSKCETPWSVFGLVHCHFGILSWLGLQCPVSNFEFSRTTKMDYII